MRILRSGIFPICFAALLPIGAEAAGPRDDLARARQLYNAGNFDGAIVAAEASRKDPSIAPAAALVIVRARLERYRLSGDPADLSIVRMELARVNAALLTPRDTIEWQIGVAETLFVDGHPGPAAELFGSLIAPARAQLTAQQMEKLIEWWAGAAAQRAEMLSPDERIADYRDILTRMESELERNPVSRSATYWIAAAARGAGELDRSWNAAVAGWVLAGALNDSSALRSDLERLVLQGLIPERAQRRTGVRFDEPAAISAMAEMAKEWQGITERWAFKSSGDSRQSSDTR
jgi:hypothetical protein